MRLVMIFAMATAIALAQRGGTSAGPNAQGHGPVGQGGRVPPTHSRRGFGNRARSPWLGPYWPSFGDDYDDEPLVPVNAPIALAPVRPTPLQPPAQTVIHEYTVPSGGTEASAAAFTIAIKDGTERLASAAWVQNGKLHYIDAQGRQQTLAPDEIDRAKTEQLNQEKHIRLQLPPG
jgi:hypothetical protein